MINGFTGISTAASNPYYIYVTNPAGSLTISSALSSAAVLVKSGAGSLILSGTNSVTAAYLNQGVLEISDLDNLGGDTGALVFAGGALRLGTGFMDDISSRTISYLLGGGTLDTNGIDITLANSLGSGAGGFTKAGAGNLTLNGTATYTGNSVLALGTVTVGANNALGNGGNLTLAAGTTLALGTNSLTHGLVSTAGAATLITGTGTISASTGFFFGNTDATQIDAVLAGSGGLFKNQTNTLTLTGLNTYTGTTEIQNGTLSINSITNVGGGASALGNAADAESGIIRMGLTTTATTLTYTGTGHTSNRLIGMQGTTGGVTLNGNGTGAVGYGGARFEMAGNKTLTLRGSSDAALINSIGTLTEVGGVLTLNKTDANTWMVNGVSSYTGVTQIDNGTLKIGVNNALPTGTTVRLGTGTTAGTLDLNGFNQTIASLLVQTNNNAVTNNLIVGAGNTLIINGAVTLGVNVNESDTNLNASGGGAIVVNSGNANFQVGAATVDSENRVDVDFSGLGSFTANLGTGTFRLGDANTGTGNSTSTFKLAVDNTITAASIRIGDGTGGGQIHTLTLGSGTNALNADTINIGSAGSTIRSSGSMIFDAGDTTGTLTIRASDGTSRATINMVNTTGNTATDISSTINLSGHTADIFASTLTMASRTQAANAATATLSFDQGTLDITTLNMASRTSTGTGNATATVNLGDSAAPGTPTTTIGAITMATNTSAGGTVIADLNITGGNVTIGSGSGTAINMANAGTGRTVTSNINLTGGAVSVTGNIIRQGGAGTENATVTLNGATLNMSGNSIGTAANQITFLAQSGTLRNLSELNGGGLFAKTTSGTLILDTSNSYTGATTVSAGILAVSHGGALGGTTNGTSVAAGGTLQLSGGITVSGELLSLIAAASDAILSSFSGSNTWTGNLTVDTGTGAGRARILSEAGSNLLISGNVNLSAGTQDFVIGGDGDGEISGQITGSQRLFKSSIGTGTWTLSGDNSSTFTGRTTVGNGALQISSESNLGATPGTYVANHLTLGG
ncbi:MAG: autotransporter-associated beta strand repeat-containing protein, partial [Gammaproteobacteria bacterium]|nr:autotransporter-associated beta strand repeat-containing protein [Gammaproteobacteria bacterium]